MTYTIELDNLARDVHAHTVAAAIAAALGADVQVPDWDTVRAVFDEDLAAPPEPGRPAEPVVDTPKAIKMRALGLAKAVT